MIEFDLGYFKEISKEVFTTDSPTGFTCNVINLTKGKVEEMGYSCKIMNNGALEVFVKGADSSKVVATSAHCDTLGLMVRSIKSNGTLALTTLGGPIVPTLDGEYCKVYTRDGKVYTGTILCNSPATHVYKDAGIKERNIDNMEVRLDEIVHTSKDVENLGIQNGDIVCYDPKFEITEKGFLKTRFIDDKASAVVLLMLLKYASENKLSFKHDTYIYFVVYEEVGHGASMVSKDIDEFVTLDIFVIDVFRLERIVPLRVPGHCHSHILQQAYEIFRIQDFRHIRDPYLFRCQKDGAYHFESLVLRALRHYASTEGMSSLYNEFTHILSILSSVFPFLSTRL